ncbi:hypothetical protein F2P81_025584 [Scophthalmus maximus]|uniref:Uncharacterized protein n=1 Tax=Scophthalmus maximus TaxID=52904 RepID=A0A6A4RJV4_SCOMX|nr:hypothetical protein F2P81_025584 [Scophthalmus maximus]
MEEKKAQFVAAGGGHRGLGREQKDIQHIMKRITLNIQAEFAVTTNFNVKTVQFTFEKLKLMFDESTDSTDTTQCVCLNGFHRFYSKRGLTLSYSIEKDQDV